ncbi:hypothetical protein [Sphingorhabdus sp.]|uniref:hypothetical protein n=1 Tax=Sphingorhabdus sp. TaxID=1902408 RepID=UPI003918B045
MQPQSETAKPVGAELLSDAKNVGSTAVDRLHSEVDARKGDAVTQVQAVSSTIERAVEGLDANAPSWLKSALEQGAQQVKSFAETLDQNDSRQMVTQVSEFAKRSPGTFLGACAAVGFAAARVFKAGSDEQSPTQLNAVSGVEPIPTMTTDTTMGGSQINPNMPRGEFV